MFLRRTNRTMIGFLLFPLFACGPLQKTQENPKITVTNDADQVVHISSTGENACRPAGHDYDFDVTVQPGETKQITYKRLRGERCIRYFTWTMEGVAMRRQTEAGHLTCTNDGCLP